jgi:hypothetical protein
MRFEFEFAGNHIPATDFGPLRCVNTSPFYKAVLTYINQQVVALIFGEMQDEGRYPKDPL